ncbi:MAG: flagellar motor switch protein FliG, partial [Acidobacteria bacterium]|nr:flagellar motor switch protein FliG [Acidobacteriota bacterium]
HLAEREDLDVTQAQIAGARKAAILMVLLGDEASAGVFRFMQEDEIQEISREISRLGEINTDVADSIVEDFYRLTLAETILARGGPEFAKRLLVKAFGMESSKKLLDYLNISLQSTLVGFDNLQKAGSLPVSLRADVVMRMANLEQISPDVISKITSILEQKLRSLGNFSRESYGGIRAVAELINRMETKAAGAILEKVECDNPVLALSIRNLMFVFDDVLLIDDQGMREILQRVDKKALTIALKGTSEELRNQFFRNMSSRAVEMMREDMEVLGPVKVKDVETAQQQIVSVVRKLDESGVLKLKGGGDEYIN